MNLPSKEEDRTEVIRSILSEIRHLLISSFLPAAIKCSQTITSDFLDLISELSSQNEDPLESIQYVSLLNKNILDIQEALLDVSSLGLLDPSNEQTLEQLGIFLGNTFDD